MKKLFLLVIMGAPMMVGGPSVSAAQSSVNLGTAGTFTVLAGSTVTNTGPSVVSGDIGVSPGTAITGFPPGIVVNGSQHSADAVALQAQTDLTTAYNDAADRGPGAVVSADLGGQTLTAGVYESAAALSLTGTVTLDGQGDPDAVFIFQAGSTLTTASRSSVLLIGRTQACNVFWQVGSSATLGTGTSFVGTIMALASVTLNTGATMDGRALARTGAVTLDTNALIRSACAPSTTSTSTTTTTSTMASSTTTTPPNSMPSSTSTTVPVANTATTATGPSGTADTTTTTIKPDDVGNPPRVPPGDLPNTGSPIGASLLVAFMALGAGAVATRCGNRRSP